MCKILVHTREVAIQVAQQTLETFTYPLHRRGRMRLPRSYKE
jgi:hypothetical protein